MTIVAVLMAAYVLLCLLYWLWTAAAVVRIRRAVPYLEDLDPPAPRRWPRLSVVAPARNEADKIAPAAGTLLAEDYPDLEIVLVNDRSTDGTGEIIDRLAAGDERVRAVHVSELPDGWLGKVNALARGLEHSTGELLLFTDADVHFRPGTLRRAVAYCLDRRLDHLAALPDVWPAGLLVDAIVAVFLRQFFSLVARPWEAMKPGAKAFVGIGAFNLVRRSAFEATEGLQWLRREVADDMGLGLMMKRSGAACGVVAAFRSLGLHWYRSLAEAARGAEKGYASVSRFSLRRMVAVVLILLGTELSPILAPLPLLYAPLRPVGWAGLAVTALFLFSAVAVARWARGHLLAGLIAPLVAPVMAAVMIRSAILGRRRGGALWRDTLYPKEMLGDGMRVRIP